MNAILFHLFNITNWLITLLPLNVLYLFSYPIYFILCYFPGYRKEIVMTNLKNAFPEKKETELKKIRRKFYMHLAEMMVEVLKLRNMSAGEMKERFRVMNPEVLDNLEREERSSIAVFGHYGNWEWIIAIQMFTEYKCLTVYKPLTNKYFDRYFKKIRTKYRLELVPMSDTLRSIIRYKNNGVNTVTALLSDQRPPRNEIRYQTKFLNQETPVYLGIEKLSVKFDMVILYLRINKIKRGYYELHIETITDKPRSFKPYEITDLHVSILEKQIKERPELWLWSHRRWKHSKENIR